MDIPEIKFIEKFLNKNDSMLEWGSGGSTVYFCQFVKEYYSIEHDKKWFDRVNDVLPSNVKYYFVPPDEPLTKVTQKSQVISYINFCNSINKKFDKVLIDGRGRQWCAETVIPYLNKDSVVFIHDYCNRKRYHVAEKYYDIIDIVKSGLTIAAFKLKSHLLLKDI